MRSHNRRSFLKTNAAIGLGAIASATGIAQACTDSKKTTA